MDMVVGKHNIEIYDDINEMPIVRYQRYQKLLLIDAGIGSDLTMIDQHIVKIGSFIKEGEKENALKELSNLRQNVFFIQSEFDPKLKAVAALVRSIDGEQVEFTESELTRVAKILSGETKKRFTALFDAVKKKIDTELTIYFPRLFVDSQIKEYYDTLKERTMAILKNIAEGKDDVEDERVGEITLKLMTFSKPTDWGGGAEVDIDKQFESVCLAISEQLHRNPKEFTTMEFYNAYELLTDRAREAKKRAK